MAVTIGQGIAANGTARANSSVTVYTETVALTSTPTVGDFVAVAIYSNRGNPTTANIQSVTLGASGGGSVTMYLLDDGKSSSGGPFVLTYGAYISVAPNGSNLVVQWKNFGLGGTTTLTLVLMEFSGTASVSTLANAVKHRFGGGLIDSGSPGVVGASLGGLTCSGNGSVTTISGTWDLGPIAIVGSYITILPAPVSALSGPLLVSSVSGSTVTVLSSYNGSTSGDIFQVYGSVVEQSNSTIYGGSQYPTAAFGILQWPGTSRIMTSYSTQQQPWIGAFVQNATSVGTRSRIGSAGCTIPTSGTFTIPCSSTTSASSTGSLILHTQNGSIVVTYTGVTANTSFDGCTVSTYPSSPVSVTGYSNLMYPTSTTQTLLGVFPNASVYNPSVLGGLTLGDSTSRSTSQTPYRANGLAAGGTVSGTLVLMVGYATSGTYANINAIGLVNGTGGSNSPFGGIWTFVPSTRGLTPQTSSVVFNSASRILKSLIRTKAANAVRVVGSKAIKTVTKTRSSLIASINSASGKKSTSRIRRAAASATPNAKTVKTSALKRSISVSFVSLGRLARGIGLTARMTQIAASRANRTVLRRRNASATQITSVSVSKTRRYGRFGSATATYAIASTKRGTFIRRVAATITSMARITKLPISPRPGEVAGSFMTAQVRGSWESANVAGSFNTASVRGAVELPLVEGAHKTAAVVGAVEILVET